MRLSGNLLPLLVLVAVPVATAIAGRSTLQPDRSTEPPPFVRGVSEAAAQIDAVLSQRAAAAGIEPAAEADELTILRRSWLAIAGTIPSLEEVRGFEADTAPDRLDRWLARMLADRRAAEHLAGLLVEALAGTDGGPPFVFRRDRFTAWLADAIHAGRPFDAVVREMVAGEGMWTGAPAVNFVTQAAKGPRVDENVLAGRVARVVLAARLDCAQCHDHPFASWTQSQFEGLAACFAGVRLSPLGVRDSAAAELRIEPEAAATGMMPAMEDDGGQMTARRVPPQVPFATEAFAGDDLPRRRLAAWLTHPSNRRFERAVANRCWMIAFGRPWHDPVDDLPAPETEPQADDPLDLLGREFRESGCDLRHTLAVLCRTAAFRRRSTHPDLDDPSRAAALADAWAVFPLSQLPPASMISAMVQAGSVRTIDPESHLLVRTTRFLRTIDFTREYGGAGRDSSEPATIPQALVRMNGRLARELTTAKAFTGPGRIASIAADDDARLTAVFLACLTRRPTAAERELLQPVLRAASGSEGVEDLYWSLFNTAEFCWNH